LGYGGYPSNKDDDEDIILPREPLLKGALGKSGIYSPPSSPAPGRLSASKNPERVNQPRQDASCGEMSRRRYNWHNGRRRLTDRRGRAMKITTDQLECWNASKDGYRWFLRRFPDGEAEYQDVLNALAEDDRPADADWSLYARVIAKDKPANLISGSWVEPDVVTDIDSV